MRDVAADFIIRVGTGIERLLQRAGGEQFVAEDMDRVRKVRAADVVVAVTIARRFFGA